VVFSKTLISQLQAKFLLLLILRTASASNIMEIDTNTVPLVYQHNRLHYGDILTIPKLQTFTKFLSPLSVFLAKIYMIPIIFYYYQYSKSQSAIWEHSQEL
jgi:hypothetical protein